MGNLSVLLSCLVSFIILFIIAILIIRYIGIKNFKKDFLNSFGVAFNDSEARSIALKKISEKNEEVDDRIIKAIELLKNLNPAEHSPFFSWWEYWINEDHKIREVQRELRELKGLAERAGYVYKRI